MTYCLNPSCPQPKNPPQAKVCKACGSKILLRNRYLAGKKIGKGGFGTTFLAVDISLPGTPLCVIKQLRPSSNDPNLLQMARELFAREAKTLGKVGNHPQVPRLLDYFEDSEQFYLIQEFVEGHNLQQEVKLNGPFSEAGARQFLTEMLPVLKYIHSQRVIHRDIKPANIIRREIDRQLVLIDFGAVKNEINTIAANGTGQTALTAFAIGTLGFAPPEQLSMRPVYASDLYALGITAIYLMTAKSPKEMTSNASTGELEWGKYVQIGEEFSNVLTTMLEYNVRDRYKSAEEVLEALKEKGYYDQLADSMIMKQSSSNIPKSANLNSIPETQVNTPTTARISAKAEKIRNLQARRQFKSKSSDHPETGLYTPDDLTLGKTSPNLQSPQVKSKPPGRSSQGSYQGKTNNNEQNEQKNKKITKLPNKLDSRLIKEAYSTGWRDFAQRHLNNVQLAQTNLSGAIFHQSQLIQVNFHKADLSNTDFGRANLRRAILRDATLTRAYLSYSNLEEADLRGADLSFASLTYANLRGANLCGANLCGANISEEQLAMAKTNWLTVFPSGRRGFL